MAGQNNLKKLDSIFYLRQFKNLRLVNLAGNPFCKDHDYRSYVLSHLNYITYLDYRRVAKADVTAAEEHHQLDMLFPVFFLMPTSNIPYNVMSTKK
eukprot:scaffold130112_cov17-Tisochrysis_lutea.AAC.1